MKRFKELANMKILPTMGSSSNNENDVTSPTTPSSTSTSNTSSSIGLNFSSIGNSLSNGLTGSNTSNMTSSILPSNNATNSNSNRSNNSMLSLFNNINFSTPSLGQDNNNFTENREKQLQNDLKYILTILQEIRLQNPSYHSGYVVVLSQAIQAPIFYHGIKFTWYRQNNHYNTFETVDESYYSWYKPTLDDIGCKICVQCEDNYQQGFSRYVECDAIVADPLLIQYAESVLRNNFYEMNGVNISMGLQEKAFIASSNSSDGKSVTESVTSSMTVCDPLDSVLLSTEENIPFLQFQGGLSSVIVDSNGLFISIPVATNDTKGAIRAPSRGLRIAPSDSIKVTCHQPSSLVIDLPILAKNLMSTGDSPEEQVDKAMESFLTSSTLTIPWSYEGAYSPEAVAGTNMSQMDDEMAEKRKKEAEDDAINYASMVCSLTEFMASLPDRTSRIKICISCKDRIERDVLVAAIRALITLPAGTTMEERMKATLPWHYESGAMQRTDSSSGTESSDPGIKSRIRSLEEENITLKRERNELYKQLMDQREAMLLKPNKPSKTEESTLSTGDTAEGGNTPGASSDHGDMSNEQPSVENNESNRSLLSKIIELENKLALATKRETESKMFIEELEKRNKLIMDENNKLVSQHDNDLIQITLLRHETTQADNKAVKSKEKYEQLEKKMSGVKGDLSQVQSLREELAAATGRIELLSKEVSERENGMNLSAQRYQEQLQESLSTIESLESRLLTQTSLVDSLQSQLKAMTAQFTEAQSRITILESENIQSKSDRALVDKFQQMATESQEEVNRLQGELNHLQHKADSQARDLKKALKDSSTVLAEFDKALVRKSYECNELQEAVYELQAEMNSMKQYMSQTDSNFLFDFKSITLPTISPSPAALNLEPIKKLIASQSSRKNSVSSSNYDEENEIDRCGSDDERRNSISEVANEAASDDILQKLPPPPSAYDENGALLPPTDNTIISSLNNSKESAKKAIENVRTMFRRFSISNGSNNEALDNSNSSAPATDNVPEVSNITSDPALQAEHLQSRSGRYSGI